MLKQAVSPPKVMESFFCPPPRPRAAELPGMASIEVRDLFPEIAPGIYLRGEDLSAVRKATENALAGIDMSMIKTQDTLNILCSEHGFSILEGKPYAEMLRTIRDTVQEKTGCQKIRLRIGVGPTQEGKEIIREHGLDTYFDGRVAGMNPHDKGVPMETEIGTLWGVARAYNADWIIHAHYDDPREVYLHRLIGRSTKSFAMSYARLETRSIFHMNFGNRSGNFVGRAIYNSRFVQKKFAFACFLMTSPAGVIGVDADNDLLQLNPRLMKSELENYGKLLRLFGEIDECIMVLDGEKVQYYLQAGGLTSGNLLYAHLDFLDLQVGSPENKIGSSINPAIKALVVNNVWTMFFLDLPRRIPTILVGQDMADRFIFDPTSPQMTEHAKVEENLAAAIDTAGRVANTGKVIVFDNSYGSINLSPSMGEFLVNKAPEVSRKVDEALLPMWLRQRGIDP